MQLDKFVKKKYIIMRSKIFKISIWVVVILGLLILMINSNLIIKTLFYHFHKIDSDKIAKIVIFKLDTNDLRDTLKNKIGCDSLIITSKKERFASEWNNSHPIGLCKYLPTYTLDIQMTDGTVRHFRICGNTIKEDDDNGFKIDEKFFDDIWNKK